MYHSVTIDKWNTWDDWRLIPASPPMVAPPAPKVKTVELAGTDGQLDMTEYLMGHPLYGVRSGTWSFLVINDYDPHFIRPWERAYADVLNAIHGKRLKAVLEDEPDVAYVGRFMVNGSRAKDYSTIQIAYTFDPFKYKLDGVTKLDRIM